MLEIAVFGLLLLVALTASHSACLDGEWEFIAQHGESRRARVPGSWQEQFPDLRDYSGGAMYRTTFTVPDTCTGNVVLLRFGAVDYFARVSVNGQVVGEHEGGYTPFELDITRAARIGHENALEVSVVDPGPNKPAGRFRFGEIPHGKQAWYGNVSGIWQSVWLECVDRRRITKLRVTPKADLSGIDVRVRVAPSEEANLEVRLSVSGPSEVPFRAVKLRPGQESAECEIPMPGALPWSPDSPNLYQLKAELLVDARPVHESSTRFGLRTIEAKERRILLNGLPIYLRSALDQDFYPHTMYTPPSKEYLLHQFRLARELGLNSLRCHIKVPDPRYLEAADEVGLLIWYEIPNWDDLTEETKVRAKDTLRDALERDHNHPSLVIVSIINEGWGVDLSKADHRKWLADMYDYAKSLDPTRLIVDNSACGGNFHVRTDINDFHCYFSIPDHADRYLNWIRGFAQRPKWAFSPHGDSQETGKEPLVVSEFGNWGLPSVKKLRECYGGDPWWFRTGDGATRPEGVEERFKAQNLARTFGDLEGLSGTFQEQELDSLKFEIEQMRLLPEIQGYVITEFTDLHWESNGLLDMCRNPKALHTASPEFQADCVVMCESGRVEVNGCACSFTPRAASPGLLPDDCKLKWQVDGGPSGESLWSEVAGKPVRFETPDSAVRGSPDPARAGTECLQEYTLLLCLIAPDGREVATNSYDFCAYPVQTPSGKLRISLSGDAQSLAQCLSARGWSVVEQDGDLLICEALGDAARGFVENGKAVLLIPKRQGLLRELPGLRIEDRSAKGRWGDWCSSYIWFAKKGPFARAPHAGRLDLSLKDLTPSEVITGLPTASPDVLSGIFVGWVASEAAIAAQARCGKGKLFVTTLPLDRPFEQGSAPAFLQDEVLRYLLSAGFAPELELQPDWDRAKLRRVVPTAEEGGREWWYSTQSPDAGWEQPDFDAGGWLVGKSGFGTPGTPGAIVGTLWNTPEIRLRTRFALTELPKAAVLRLHHDEDVEVYINGRKVFAEGGYVTGYDDRDLSPEALSAFRIGENVLAACCRQAVGGQFVDAGLAVE